VRNESRGYYWFAHIFLLLFSIVCVVPFLLLTISSFTDNLTLVRNGYSFFAEKYSLSAYQYLWEQSDQLLRANGITVLITAVGTTAGLIMMALIAYPISRRDFPLRKSLTFYVVFTMLFNGGLVPTYLVYTQLFDVKNTIWALIIPGLLMNGFSVLLIRTFFQNSIPVALIESAKIDGASELRILWKIVLPLSTPIMATIGLFQGIHYWNDWMNGLIYITDPKLYSMQNLLNRMITEIQFLVSNDVGQVTDMSELPTVTMRMAIAVVGILPIVITYPYFQKYFAKGMTVGAVKG